MVLRVYFRNFISLEFDPFRYCGVELLHGRWNARATLGQTDSVWRGYIDAVVRALPGTIGTKPWFFFTGSPAEANIYELLSSHSNCTLFV
jgi:hypothetical protein